MQVQFQIVCFRGASVNLLENWFEIEQQSV